MLNEHFEHEIVFGTSGKYSRHQAQYEVALFDTFNFMRHAVEGNRTDAVRNRQEAHRRLAMGMAALGWNVTPDCTIS